MIYRVCGWSRSNRRPKGMALDLGGLREQRIQCIYNLHGRPTWQQVDNVSWSNGYCVGSLKKNGSKHKTRGHDNQLHCHWLL